MLEIFNKDSNKFEFYLAKIMPEVYINNYRYLLKKEQINNEMLNSKLRNPNIKKTKKLLDLKMTSDKLLTTYNAEVIKASNLYAKYPNGIVISGVGVKIGNVFGTRYKNKAEFSGGAILVFLGIKILLDHFGIF